MSISRTSRPSSPVPSLDRAVPSAKAEKPAVPTGEGLSPCGTPLVTLKLKEQAKNPLTSEEKRSHLVTSKQDIDRLFNSMKMMKYVITSDGKLYIFPQEIYHGRVGGDQVIAAGRVMAKPPQGSKTGFRIAIMNNASDGYAPPVATVQAAKAMLQQAHPDWFLGKQSA